MRISDWSSYVCSSDLKFGLTGGIGSGKSRVADLFAQWGDAVIDTDVIAHELTAPGGVAIEAIRHQFGPDVISPPGARDRQALRELVFENHQSAQQSNTILHTYLSEFTQKPAYSEDGNRNK